MKEVLVIFSDIEYGELEYISMINDDIYYKIPKLLKKYKK